jgi:cytochrome c
MIGNIIIRAARLARGRRSARLAALTTLMSVVLFLTMFSASAQEPLEPPSTPDAFGGLPVFSERCANCHGDLGQGDGEMAGNLPKRPRDFTDETFRRTAVPAVLFQTITEGILESGMPPFGPLSSNPITDEGRWDLVATIYSLSTPPEALENGRIVYEENCLSCHGEQGVGDGPEVETSTTAPPDLSETRYWTNRSNEMVFASLQNAEISDHTYSLAEADLWDVTDYMRTFSYVYADAEAAAEPIQLVTISGQVSNGTVGDLIANGTVLLRAFTPDLQEALSLETELGPDGHYSFDVADADPDWVYMSSVEHGDISFSSSPDRVQRSDPQLDMPIVVYDTTDDPTAININQVHMIIDFAGDRLRVSEIYVISNREPAVFVGESGDAESGTLQVAVPEAAENVEFQRSFRSFENFLPAPEVVATDSGYADTVPVRPGDGAMNLLVSYELPFEDGIKIEHPLFYDTNSATIVVPDVGVDVEGDAWVSQGVQQMGNAGTISSYSRPGLAAGEAISFSLAGRPAAVSSASSTAPISDGMTGIFVGGAAVLLAAGGASFVIRSWQSAADESEAMQENRKQQLLYALASLDEAFEKGSLDEAEYGRRRAEMVDELAAIWDAPEK